MCDTNLVYIKVNMMQYHYTIKVTFVAVFGVVWRERFKVDYKCHT